MTTAPTIDEVNAALAELTATLRRRGYEDKLGEVNWTYDVHGMRTSAIQRAGAVVMGFNAGAGGRGSESRWKSKCDAITAGISGGYVLAELVLIASHNVGVLERAHTDLAELIALCAAVNKEVIAYHRPKVIFHPGLHRLGDVQRAYGLELVNTEPVRRPRHPKQTLLWHYDLCGMPWLAMRHFSSWGFSNADITAVRDYASRFCGVDLSGRS